MRMCLWAHEMAGYCQRPNYAKRTLRAVNFQYPPSILIPSSMVP